MFVMVTWFSSSMYSLGSICIYGGCWSRRWGGVSVLFIVRGPFLQ